MRKYVLQLGKDVIPELVAGEAIVLLPGSLTAMRLYGDGANLVGAVVNDGEIVAEQSELIDELISLGILAEKSVGAEVNRRTLVALGVAGVVGSYSFLALPSTALASSAGVQALNIPDGFFEFNAVNDNLFQVATDDSLTDIAFPFALGQEWTLTLEAPALVDTKRVVEAFNGLNFINFRFPQAIPDVDTLFGTLARDGVVSNRFAIPKR